MDFEDGIQNAIKNSGPMLELKDVDSIRAKAGGEKCRRWFSHRNSSVNIRKVFISSTFSDCHF